MSEFNKGDRVIHPRRPEWGQGVVEQAGQILHQGQPAQRLTVRFVNHGRVTVNSAVAQLKRQGELVNMTTTSTKAPTAQSAGNAGKGWLAALEDQQNDQQLWSLPDAMKDPFATLEARLQATLDSYRYCDPPTNGQPRRPTLPRDPRKLLEWAIAQTGLTDPMTKYTRHEIELGFQRFARDRDLHLADLAREGKRGGEHHTLHEVAKRLTNPVARLALADAIRAA